MLKGATVISYSNKESSLELQLDSYIILLSGDTHDDSRPAPVFPHLEEILRVNFPTLPGRSSSLLVTLRLLEEWRRLGAMVGEWTLMNDIVAELGE